MRAAALAMGVAALCCAAEKDRLVEGNADSAVRVVIYEDLACGDCFVFRKTLDSQLLPKFGKTVAFEHRDFPLAKHPWARDAAVASRYFGTIRPELALEWRRYTLEHRKEIAPENFRETLAKWADAHGANAAAAIAALADESYRAPVEADYSEGVARGIAKTPTALVDGEPFIETIPFEDISKAIERALGNGRR